MDSFGPQRIPRLAPRISVRLDVELHNMGEPAPAHTVNLSRGGMLVRGDFPPLTEHPLKLTLFDPSHEQPLPLRAKLIRLVPSPVPHEDDLAVRFVDLSPHQEEQVERFISRALESCFGLPAKLHLLQPGSAPARKILREIPLKDRLTIARRGARKERQQLIFDPDFRILETLCRNPQLDLQEVRLLVKRRDMTTGSLRQLGSRLKFIQDFEIRRALLTHPKIDLDTLEAVVAHASPVEIKHALRQSSVKPEVRQRLLQAL